MDKSEKKSPILIVTLLILGLLFICFCIWLGINYNKQEVDEGPSSSQTQKPKVEEINFPQGSDNNVKFINFFDMFNFDVKEIYNDFKNLKVEKDGNKYVYNCESYIKEENNG